MSFTTPGTAFRGFEAYRGGTKYCVLTASQGTNALVVKSGPGRVAAICNTGASPQTVAIAIWDAVDASLTGGVLLWTGIPGSSGNPNPWPLDIPCINGIVVKAASAITGTVLVQYV
jgi:hypothetical protein